MTSRTLSQLAPLQPQAVDTLRTAILGGRRHHAYVLVGQNMDIAAELAQAVAQALVCQAPQDGSACGECAGCRKLAGDNHPDVLRILPNEKGNIIVQDIRDCAARLALRATESATKVVIMLEADRMLPPAQNALLKTLEEPPGPTCFLLTTSRYRSLLPTVRSRSQRVRLTPPSRQGAQAALREAGIDEQLAPVLSALVGADAERAQAMVDAGAADILADLRASLEGNTATLLHVAADIGSDAARTQLALTLLEVELRDRLALHHGASVPHLASAPQQCTPAALARAVDRLIHLREMAPHHLNRVLSLEGLLMELTEQDRAGD